MMHYGWNIDIDGAGRRSCVPIAVTVALIVAVLGIVPDTATAEAPKPLKMTFVDATPNQSAAIHDKLRSVIERNEGINFTDPADFLFSANKFDVTLETFASSDQREAKKELIRRSMRANDLEAILVYKRQDDELHLIVIGPTGAQLEHYRSPIRQPTINDKQAIAVLKKIFEVLVPRVRTFRKQNPDAQQANPQPPSDQPDSSSDGQPTDETTAEAEDGGRLNPHLTVSLGPVLGTRKLVVDTPDTPGLVQHGTPIFGGRARLDAISGLLDSSTAALGATAFLEFAPFRTKFTQIDKTPKGTYLKAGGQLRYLSAISSTVTLFGQIGGEFLDIGLTSNPIYVGSSYFAFTGGAGARFHFVDALSATVEANLLPTLLTDTNEGAFGPGSFSLGISAGAELELRSFDPLLLSASYHFTMLSPNHPKPTFQAYSGPASGNDIFHVGGASIGYQF